jgi:hypothetical protein
MKGQRLRSAAAIQPMAENLAAGAMLGTAAGTMAGVTAGFHCVQGAWTAAVAAEAACAIISIIMR